MRFYRVVLPKLAIFCIVILCAMLVTSCTNYPTPDYYTPTVQTATVAVATSTHTVTQVVNTQTATPTFQPIAVPTCPPIRDDLYASLALRTFIDDDLGGAHEGITATVLFSSIIPLPADVPSLWSVTTNETGVGTWKRVLPGVYTYVVASYQNSTCLRPFVHPEAEIAFSVGEQAALDIPFIVHPSCQPTVTPTPTATPAPVARGVPAGAYCQYDYACQYPLVLATAPSGDIMELCPNGLNSDGTFKNNNAFREAGGMNWPKLGQGTDTAVIDMGGTFWVAWRDINPSEGIYNWSVIDTIVEGAKKISMDSADGPAVKGVVIRLYAHTSTRPAQDYVGGIDGGFIFDDLTPQWVKSRLKASVPWGGPTILSTGSKVTQDNGSYWVRMPCVYADYQASKPQGSKWDYSIWVVPKYDRAEWRAAATRMLTDVGRHYEGSGVAFLLGMNGVDGENGNPVQNSFAGCGNIRAALTEQYKPGDLLWRDMVHVWRAAAPTLETYVSCTSDCNPNWFIGQGVGLFQARLVDDGPNYHRTGDIGVLDWALRWPGDVAWENAYAFADDAYLYKMLSLGMAAWPKWMSFVGGSWGNEPMIRTFLPEFGKTITTTSSVWVKMYWTCYGYPSQIKCPNVDTSMVSSLYMGWMKNAERGLVLDAELPIVNPWTDLTAAQRADYRAKMLRLVNGTVGLTVSPLWPVGKSLAPISVSVIWLDKAATRVSVSCVGATGEVEYAWDAVGSGEYVEREIPLVCDLSKTVDGVHSLTLTASGLALHEVEVKKR